jgi:hypothetical protein
LRERYLLIVSRRLQPGSPPPPASPPPRRRTRWAPWVGRTLADGLAPTAGRARGGLTGGGAGMLVQGFFAHPPDGRGPSFVQITLALGVAIAGVALGFIIATLGSGARRRLARWRAARRRARRAQLAEARARAQMSELCPHGWRAQITLYAGGEEPAPDAPAGPRGWVALDWSELEPDGQGVAVSRRVWAASITEALEAMVADRRTDETLERIEREVWHPDA